MTVKIIQIGNSQGIRIPKAVLQQAGLEGEVTLRVDGEQVILSPAKKKRKPREGWEEAMLKAIAEHGNELSEEDREWLDAPLSEEADKDWTW